MVYSIHTAGALGFLMFHVLFILLIYHAVGKIDLFIEVDSTTLVIRDC